jgi:glyoxylase-like metal-dependent hydrolase (beta-lactamase superfamily II)
MQTMGRSVTGLVLLLALGCSDDSGSEAQERGDLDQLLDALGGEAVLDGLTGLRLETSGSRHIPHEGVTPADEPILANNFRRVVSIDFEEDALRIDTSREIEFLFAGEQAYTDIVRGNLGASNEAFFGAPIGPLSALGSDKVASIRRQETLLTPHLLLKTLDLGDLSEEEHVTLDGVEHHRLVSDDGPAPLTLYISEETGLLTKLETMELDFYQRDVKLEVRFSNWAEAGETSYPRNVAVVRDGLTLLTQQVSEVTLDPNFAADTFAFPDGVNPTFDPSLFERGELSHQWYYLLDSIGLPFSGVDTSINAADVAEGVVQLVGASHHSFLVEQADGIVLVDAPLYDDRGRALFEYIDEQFPGKPITHVVASHFHEDHVAGIREVLGSTNAELVVHASVEQYWRNVLGSPSTLRPDALARTPRQVTIRTVPEDGQLTLEDADHPVTLYHLNTSHAADMLLTHEESSNSVFVVDIYSPGNSAQFGAADFAAALEQYDISFTNLNIVGGHGSGIHNYDDLETFL